MTEKLSYQELELQLIELQHQLDDLRKSDTDAMDGTEYIGNLQHELFTPLHAILNYSKFGIEKTAKLGIQKLHHYCTQINKAGVRLAIVVNSLLEIMELEQTAACEMREADLIELIEEVVSRFQRPAKNKRLSILTHAPSSLDLVSCNRFKMMTLIHHLLSNAIKFSPCGKEIVIQVNTLELEEQKRYSSRQDPMLMVAIKDQGAGIPEDELNHIFCKGYQSRYTKTGAGGLGLGLAICYKIIQLHQGKIWAENNANTGSTFKFILPFYAG